MLACCKNCAYGHKARHSARNAQCAAGQAASINDLCSTSKRRAQDSVCLLSFTPQVRMRILRSGRVFKEGEIKEMLCNIKTLKRHKNQSEAVTLTLTQNLKLKQDCWLTASGSSDINMKVLSHSTACLTVFIF